jgi:peptide/nickel transport system substrate-binding protein
MNLLRRTKSGKIGLALLMATMAAMLGVPATSAATAKSGVQNSGSLTVTFVNYTWTSLDPVTYPFVGSENNLFEPIFGALFYQRPTTAGGGKGPIIVPGEATGYKFSDNGLLVTITLRKGLRFSDGTPFNSQAVASDILRVISPATACTCDVEYGVIKSITTPNSFTDVLHLSHAEPYIIENFPATAVDYIDSPTALASEGEVKFEQYPVGAGPYEVVSDTYSSQLVLQKNPSYYIKGEPHLDKLTFLTTAADQSAYSTLEAGESQMEVGITTSALIKQAAADPSQLKVWQIGGVGSNGFYFNADDPPFNNILAREAVSYATDPQQVWQILSPNFGLVWETGSGPASVFPERYAAGFRNYNLAKAEALVKQLGGLSFTLLTGTSPAALQQAEVYQNEWQAAGMTVAIKQLILPQEVVLYEDGGWQASTTTDGGFDPDINGGGLTRRFESGGQYNGVNDPALNGLINKSVTFVNPTTRLRIFDEINAYINAKDYGEFLYEQPLDEITASNVTGVVLSPYLNNGAQEIQWEDLGYQK